MRTTLPIGLIMIGVAVFMFVIAMPRRGEQARFLRGRESLEIVYAMLFILLLTLGGTISLSHWD